MPKPKALPTANPQASISQATAANLTAGQQSQGMSTIGQNNPYGSLEYTTTIDPITGLPKYQANMKYTTEQQNIFNQLQQQQLGAGSTGFDNISNNFGNYTQDPEGKLLSNTSGLTKDFMDAQNPEWERFMAPERDQKRTQLINQGIVEGSPAYQLEMDKITQQQLRTKGAALAQFQPQAFNEASQTLNMPLEWEKALMAMSQPGNINQNLVNTPQGQVAAPDVMGAFNTAQQGEMFNRQQQNAYWNNIISGGIGVGKAAMGIPSFGGSGSPGTDSSGNR